MGLVREITSYNARVRKLYKAIVEADLTAAVNGTAQDIALGFLPPGAVLLCAPNIALVTQFTGGAASAVGLTIGTAAAPTLVATSFDIFGAAATGLFVPMTLGAQRVSPAGGQALIARITPDGAHTLLALTAGSLALEVYFSLPAVQ